jgi:hypothetical protein
VDAETAEFAMGFAYGAAAGWLRSWFRLVAALDPTAEQLAEIDAGTSLAANVADAAAARFLDERIADSWPKMPSLRHPARD